MVETVEAAVGLVTTKKQIKGRSPSYPAVPLEVAVVRAGELYDSERRNAAPIEAIQALWGYKKNTGPANLAVAALKKYGLITDSGSGKLRTAQLTQLGFDVVHHPDPEARLKAVQEAALMPSIHKIVWERYRREGLPSDATLRYYLVNERSFTETGASEFISQFRKTVAFAKLTEATSLDPVNPDQDDPGAEEGTNSDQSQQHNRHGERRHKPLQEEGMLTIPVPIIGGKPVTIEGQFPISNAGWDQFIAVLQAMKPGLVSDDEEL